MYQTNTSVVAVIPLTTRGPQSGRRRGRSAAWMYLANMLPVLPPYAECEVTPAGAEGYNENPPPSYDETMAREVQEPSLCLPNEVRRIWNSKIEHEKNILHEHE